MSGFQNDSIRQQTRPLAERSLEKCCALSGLRMIDLLGHGGADLVGHRVNQSITVLSCQLLFLFLQL